MSVGPPPLYDEQTRSGCQSRRGASLRRESFLAERFNRQNSEWNQEVGVIRTCVIIDGAPPAQARLLVDESERVVEIELVSLEDLKDLLC